MWKLYRFVALIDDTSREVGGFAAGIYCTSVVFLDDQKAVLDGGFTPSVGTYYFVEIEALCC